MTRSRYKITSKGLPHFLTCTVVNWIPVFARPKAAQTVLDSLRYLQAKEELVIFGFIIMENHLHMIASGKDLPNIIRRFKSFTARKIIDYFRDRGEKAILEQLSNAKVPHKEDRRYQFWQEGNHPILIQNDEMMRQKLEYIHNNPVRRGYVDNPAHWRYSSARNYAGQEGLLEVTVTW
ncbi:MAG: transposase [Deltaproteobacteria bacterium]|nr:MAG: transposase [Deltaproteobacteria bacterium]